MKKPLPLSRPRSGALDLVFTHHDRIAHASDPLWEDVSSLAVIGRSVFCSCDETASVERVLIPTEGDGPATRHVSFPLGLIFDLPAGPMGEMDIEGLCCCDGWLWICGSHSLKRGKPKTALADLRDIDWDPNRGFLARVPLRHRGRGVFEPVKQDGSRRAAMLPMRKGRSTALRKLVKDDPLLGPFMDLPCKEGGFDVEGLAVRGDQVLLGLRGPVLRGHALLLRLDLKVTKEGFLKPRKLPNGRRYALHAVDLNGQGVRDMAFRDGRLLILSGATGDVEALQSVFALDWDPSREVWTKAEVERVLDLEIQRGADHAEGMALTDGPEPRLLIAYDSPHNDRTDAEAATLTADLFEID